MEQLLHIPAHYNIGKKKAKRNLPREKALGIKYTEVFKLSWAADGKRELARYDLSERLIVKVTENGKVQM